MKKKGSAKVNEKVNDIQVQIRMPKALRLKADEVAWAERRKFSDWARLLIEAEVKRYEATMALYEKTDKEKISA